MEQNQILFYIMAIGCTLCVMLGIYKNPVYLLILAARGIFCAALVYGIHMFCAKNGIQAPVDLNFLSVGTGALFGLPGIIVLYAAGILIT